MEYISRKLIEIDIDVASVVARLGGNEQIYLSICRKYLRDQNLKFLQESIVKNDFSVAEFYVHTLKGTAANLGFIRLEALCKAMLDDLRRKEYISLQTYITNLCEEHNQIVSILNEEQV